MIGPDYFGYDMNGSALTMSEYLARTKEDPNWRRVAKTMVGEREVSTVLLSLDHGCGQGRPIIFETMTFPDQSIMQRYCTLAEVIAGHAEIVAECEAEAKERAK